MLGAFLSKLVLLSHNSNILLTMLSTYVTLTLLSERPVK